MISVLKRYYNYIKPDKNSETNSFLSKISFQHESKKRYLKVRKKMHYFYLMLLVLSTTNAYINFKETILSILDPSKNNTEKIKILKGLSKYLQKNAIDNKPEKSRVTVPVFNEFNQRKNWKEPISSPDVKLSKRLVRRFVPITLREPQGDDDVIITPKPYGFKCGGPREQDMHWGTCVLPEKCSEEFRIHLGDNFCDKTAYICCDHMGTSNYPSLVNALKHDNRFTDIEDDNEADAIDKRKAAVIRKKLKRAKRINSMLSPSLMKEYTGRRLQPKLRNIEEVKPERVENTGYDLDVGSLFIIQEPLFRIMPFAV